MSGDAAEDEWIKIPLPSDFRDLLQKRLESKQPGKTKTCDQFIAEIIAKAIQTFNQKQLAFRATFDWAAHGNSQFVPVVAEASSGLGVLKNVREFQLVESLNFPGGGAGGTVRGSIAGGDATVLIVEKGYFSPPYRNTNPVATGTNWYIGTAIHEIAHLAKPGVTNDEGLAQAVYALGYTKEKPIANAITMKDILTNSNIYQDVLVQYCGRR